MGQHGAAWGSMGQHGAAWGSMGQHEATAGMDSVITSSFLLLTDAFIQSNLQSIRLSRGQSPLEQCGVKSPAAVQILLAWATLRLLTTKLQGPSHVPELLHCPGASPVCALCVPCVCPVCALCVPCVRPPCVRPVCALCAPCVRPVCALCAPCVRPVCALCAPCVRPVCALCAPCVRPASERAANSAAGHVCLNKHFSSGNKTQNIFFSLKQKISACFNLRFAWQVKWVELSHLIYLTSFSKTSNRNRVLSVNRLSSWLLNWRVFGLFVAPGLMYIHGKVKCQRRGCKLAAGATAGPVTSLFWINIVFHQFIPHFSVANYTRTVKLPVVLLAETHCLHRAWEWHALSKPHPLVCDRDRANYAAPCEPAKLGSWQGRESNPDPGGLLAGPGIEPRPRWALGRAGNRTPTPVGSWQGREPNPDPGGLLAGPGTEPRPDKATPPQLLAFEISYKWIVCSVLQIETNKTQFLIPFTLVPVCGRRPFCFPGLAPSHIRSH